MMPTALAMLLVFVYPLLLSLWSSFHYDVFTQPARYHFVGVQNYVVILRDPLFWNALRNSLVFFVATVVGTMVVGTTIALLLDRDLGRFSWVKTLYLLPMVIAPVVVGIQWRFMLNYTFGVIPYFTKALHLPTKPWLTEPFSAMVWLVVVDLWYYTPIVILLISGTASIDEKGDTVHVGDLRAQLRRTFDNITGLLASEGATWHDIVRTTCYLRDIERDYKEFNEERAAFYKEQGLDPLPASTGIQAILCRPDLLIEIEAIAMFRTESPTE